MTCEDLLRERRRRISARLFALGESPTAAATADFQRELAAEIIWAERAQAQASRDEREDYQDHLRLLRAHGDAIAWTHLHPHAIRQFRKGGVRGQALSSQAEAVEGALQIAESIAEAGVVAIVCDLTSELRIGDLIVADSYDAPTIVECKKKLPRDNALLLGRVGRQAARIHGTAKYLHEGKADVHDEPLTRIVFESKHSSEPRWREVRDATDRALAEQRGHLRELEPGAVMWVCFGDEDLPEDLGDYIGAFRRYTLGLHLRFLDDDAPLMPPPLAWPISDEARWQLAEGAMSIAVFLDVERFSDIAAERGAKLVVDDDALKVEHEGVDYRVSLRFIDECVYNYYPIADQVDVVLELVASIHAAGITPAENAPSKVAHESPVKPGGPQRLHRVRSEEQLREVAGRSGGRDLVMVSGELMDQLTRHARARVIYFETGNADPTIPASGSDDAKPDKD